MNRKLALWVALFTVTLAALMTFAVAYGQGDPHPRVVVYVRNQGLYYDSIVNGPLPPHGRFQLLENVAGQLETDFGPGDRGYLGGRWMMNTPDGVIYFSCPLLPPGRETP
jgi:hypothetical protein